jgi:anti-anti-sigma regulatory factor
MGSFIAAQWIVTAAVPDSPAAMNLTFLLIGFALAVFIGSALVSLLATVRPQWSTRRRRLTAASVLPAITIVATLLGMLFIGTAHHGESEQMEDLALAAVATIGGGFALIAWIGGLVGATLTSRRLG